MAMPTGIQRKVKKNDKHPRAHEDWQKGKRIGRPAQQFNAELNTWAKVMTPRKVED